ncbi:MAG TPA: HTTM domain-containing protein [Gammaproteobacteria bacterium]|nr:HTTM domain-containing protein [Gammaproteobacteria bacterium]
MSFDEAMRLTEILLGFAFAQQSIEHFNSFAKEQRLFIPRFFLALLLIAGVQADWVLLLLFLLGLVQLYYFQGPYNGGSDRMSLLILSCLCLAEWAPGVFWRELAFGYLAVQLVFSYFFSGWVKIINPEWRSGRALRDVFLFSVYPVSESLRLWSTSPRILFVAAWGVMLFELIFPLGLLMQCSLMIALVVAASFHLANACLFGLNRFFWIWLAAYPSLLWFQQRFVSALT